MKPNRPISLVRIVKLFLLLGLMAYLVLCGAMGFAQRSFLYFPQVFTPSETDSMAVEAGLVRWTNASGANIGFKRLSLQQPATGIVLMMYGNGSTATGSARYADAIQKAAALDFYVLEYPGYEDRPGPPTEKKIFAAADDALQMLPTNKPVYLIGESLGSGVASYLAGTHPDRIAGALLISPFTSITDVARHHYPILPVGLLLADKFPSEDYLRNYHGKIGITVDGKDIVVPEKFGLRLYNGYAGPKKLWQFPDGTHCQIPDLEFWNQLVAFWQSP